MKERKELILIGWKSSKTKSKNNDFLSLKKICTNKYVHKF